MSAWSNPGKSRLAIAASSVTLSDAMHVSTDLKESSSPLSAALPLSMSCVLSNWCCHLLSPFLLSATCAAHHMLLPRGNFVSVGNESEHPFIQIRLGQFSSNPDGPPSYRFLIL